MDPPTLIHTGAFQSANNATSSSSSSYNMAEIWPFPINGCARDLSRIQLGRSLGQFGDNANRDGSADDPMAVDHIAGARKRRDADEPAKVVSTSTANGMNDCNGKRKKNNDPIEKSSKQVEENMKTGEPSKLDYIHVRARRGQATDSHSLAERARREKISQRMKLLQDLVPGCNKVIGKALVLDEIINYIQSLQRQVEFLSMKLEAVNSRMDPNIEGGFSSKDFGQQTYETGALAAFGSQGTTTTRRGDYARSSSSPEWLHMQIGGNNNNNFERST